MPVLAFHIRRKRRLSNLLVRDTLERALGSTYYVSLKCDNREIPMRVGGKDCIESETNWGDQESQKALLDFLERYRSDPGGTRLRSEITQTLHKFLFSGNKLDALFVQASRGLRALFVHGRSDDRSFVNIPWELADVVPAVSDQSPPLRGTLASLPLARVVSGTSSSLVDDTKRRLHVLYCISQPTDVEPFLARDFSESIEKNLGVRSGMLNYRPVLGTNGAGKFSPTFDQFLSDITTYRPHVIVLACHGRTRTGQPELRFEQWRPVGELADVLAQVRTTFLVLLIACDQVYLQEMPSAQSGAITLLDKGIPAVVAMQSSVDAMLAGEFLGTTIDWLFQNASVYQAVAAGRRKMGEGDAAQRTIDWCFPALSITEDAPPILDDLSGLVESYIPTLEAMWRSIDEKDYYFPRPNLEDSLSRFIASGECGLRMVVGGNGNGKTFLVCHVCRLAIKQAIEERSASFRPILYVDVERHAGLKPVQNLGDLVDMLSRRTEEVQMVPEGAVALHWPKARGADGEGIARNVSSQLASSIDSNNMILVLDNIVDATQPPWPEFIRAILGRLLRSVVVVVSDNECGVEINEDRLLPVKAFDETQTQSYVGQYLPGFESHVLYEKTGGNPVLLDAFRRAQHPDRFLTSLSPDGIAIGYMTMTIDRIETHHEDLSDLLYAMTHLPNGINGELANTYVGDWRGLLRLEQGDIFVREYRYNLSDPWLRLPGMHIQVLRQYRADQVDAAGKRLVDSFKKRVGANVMQHLIELAGQPGGIDFLHDIHETMLEYDEGLNAAVALPLLLHKRLFENGRWYDAFRFWSRILDCLELEDTEAHEWLRLAKAAHVLGLRRRALDSLEYARNCEPTTLDQIDMLILQASLIKDSGETERADEIKELYDKALDLVGEAEKTDLGEELADYEERLALIHYNRGVFQRWWLHNLDGALADFDTACKIYEALGETYMRMVARSERVDVQIDSSGTVVDWSELLQQLLEAEEYFGSIGNQGDYALCAYRLGRYYRRRPASDKIEQARNLAKAKDAYSAAAKQAEKAGDTRLGSIAESHVVEVSCFALSEMTSSEAVERLAQVIDRLQVFEGDAWSTRVLRDSMFWRASALGDLGAEEVVDHLCEAWRIACQPPLHPDRGTDAQRAARALHRYLSALQSQERYLDIDRVAVANQALIERWLGKPIDPTSVGAWLSDLHAFSVISGGDYGESER